MAGTKRDEQGDVLTRTRADKPKRYKVLIHNDDYTTMEFVIHVLQSVFRHTLPSATRLMLAIHKTGLGIAGVYAREIAETRVEQTLALAREHGHPLQCTMEPE
ncbi:MAG: ATP-dependent Clp protease adapter ClpS [Alphaproteobacteria bacterium]|nr:ATP-dependent Clp protease adapter ClpS [Alphaproteobacteria bacterium]